MIMTLIIKHDLLVILTSNSDPFLFFLSLFLLLSFVESVLFVTLFHSGTIQRKSKDTFVSKGSVEEMPSKNKREKQTTLRITELPIKKWTQDYKEFLDNLLRTENKEKNKMSSFLRNYSEHHTGRSLFSFFLSLFLFPFFHWLH